ncbi:hypothetical protein ABB37_04535 [Leptomonas pyrrhocoris]|uniref:Uncharacterized protein n=1 Tax=Leptomonas pyrrhocoris TaxID=157538 RepID=A0A0N0DW23_LEPPY|nr:hypothetical protein ABB37_04535 [Leptomonas pyrrhocoris]KPA81198.1 hypothetical protein ABB37_04535 [Leptomonas pyrrhocoris]|eukprot:XP_015659637.1 hypothetical protein ABB37_04535 [Leptomonas pyrrhocoris]
MRHFAFEKKTKKDHKNSFPTDKWCRDITAAGKKTFRFSAFFSDTIGSSAFKRRRRMTSTIQLKIPCTAPSEAVHTDLGRMIEMQ